MLISLIPTVAFAENSENILYEEHFESETIKDEIENKQYGWSWDAADNASDKAAFQVEENDYSYPNGGNFLRFASTDWYKSMWTVLDLQENGIYKLVQNGESQSDAKAAVSEYLSNNISVSFKAKFEADGKDNAKHEAYIRIKNAENEAIAELSTYCENKSDTGSLVLKALNNEKTEIEEYKIADISWQKENTDWHDFKIDFNITNNTYRLTVDGEVFKDTPYGSWIPSAAIPSDNTTESSPCEIGMIKSLEMGHSWSGWWQCIGVDDIVLTEGDWTSEGPNETPTVIVTPSPEPDSDVDYIEDFEGANTEQNIKEQNDGWSYDGTSDSASHINLWVGNNLSDSNSLRFASDTWYKTMWLIMNVKENFIKKKTESGIDTETATKDVTEYLNGDFKLSFDAKFEQQGTDGTHEQYIRIKGSDNHAIAELHLMDDKLGIIALNKDKTANEFYEIKTIDWSKGNKEWHNFAIYFNHEKDAYMVEVDGEIFKGTSYGKWIPGGSESGIGASSHASLGTIESIEFGHFWSAYWQNMCIDNIALSQYEPTEDEYEIGSITIKNEHGGTVLTKGNSYSAEVNAIGGETADTQLSWEYSTDNGVSWKALESSTVPNDATHIKVSVICTSTDGKTATGEAQTEIAETGEVDYVEIVGENFEESDKETEILNQKNGWSLSGQSYQAKVGTGFGGTRNSLRFASTASNATNNLRLDLVKRGATFETNDKLYLKFDYSFGLGSDEDTVNSASLAYIRIKDTNNKAFTTISLLGDKMYMSYYDEAEGKNKQAVIAQGQDVTLDIWRTMELYLDTEKNKYCMLIDGKAIRVDGTGWFIPSDTIVTGIGKPNEVKGIGAIEIGQENSAWWENTCIDNISLQRYYLPADSTLTVSGINPVNGYDAAKKIVTGGSVTAVPQTEESTILSDEIYIWEYYNGSDWVEMTNNIVPENAEKVRATGKFTDVYGQTAQAFGEAEVSKNSAPAISNLKVTGSVESGQVLKAEYTYTDADGDEDDSIYIWLQSRTLDGTYKEISREKEYTVKDKDAGSYIKLQIIPRDNYGVCGNTVEYSIEEGEDTLFNRVWKKINIPSEPSGSSVYLPESDEENGVTLKWVSSDNSIVSNSGVINRPLYGYKTVTLTCTATDKDGNTSKKTYTVTIKGSSGSSSGSGGGGGGSSSGGSSGSNVNIKHVAAAPVTSWTDDESDNNGTGEIINPVKRYFNDIDGGEWYASNIFELKKRGIIDGDDDGNFRPGSMITRAEFVKLIVELLKIKDNEVECNFTDVDKDAWYYPYVASALKFNIVNGMGDGSFGTNLNIKRQDMAVMAAAAIELSKELDGNGDLSEFIDSTAISDYAVEGVKKLTNAGIMQGSDNMFRPADNATRAEAASVIYMIAEYLK